MTEEKEKNKRDSVIVRTSIIGILTNVLLVAFKATVGILSNSIAIMLDAVNNLSDALSSVITIAGTKLASKKPDKKHPLGYGRIEYLSAMIVSALVLYAGITSIVESVKKIIHPQKAEYTTVTLVIISVAVAAKIILGLYVRSRGKKVNSGALTASGSDALFDAILSFSVLVSAVVFMIFGISLEAYVGVVISCFIIKSGIEMMLETLGDLIGRRPDAEISKKIKAVVNEEEEVRGAFDLFINDYGPNRNFASVHVELPDTMSVEEVDALTRRIEKNVYLKTGVVLTAVGVYSYNTKADQASMLRDGIRKMVLAHEWALGFHGFFVNEEEKTVRFDVVMKFGQNVRAVLNDLRAELETACEGYTFEITPDIDVSD